MTEFVDPTLPYVPACIMQREYQVKSVAAGPDVKQEDCGNPATVLRLIHGVPTLVCERCADEMEGESWAEDPS